MHDNFLLSGVAVLSRKVPVTGLRQFIGSASRNRMVRAGVSIMRFLVFVVFAAFAASMVSAEAGQPVSDAVTETITRQIEAFRRDDAAAAFAIASPAIQKRFGTPETFIGMVARGYPQVYRPQSFRFAERAPHAGGILQKVIVVGPDGVTVAAYYQVVQINGEWRINGCQIARLPGQDV
jgi:ABC-type transporter MlaC component